MTVLQAVSARFTGGKTPSLVYPADTTAGSDLLAIVVYSNNNSSTVTQHLTSDNPANQAWGSPYVSTALAGASGLTLLVYHLGSAQKRVAHDPSSGAAFNEVLTLNTGTFSTIYLLEQDADIESIDIASTPVTGTSTTIAAPVTTRQYGDVILGIHANRNTTDQTATAPAIFLPTTGAGNPVPIGVAANAAAIEVGVTLTSATTVGTYTPTTTIGTSRNWLAFAIAFKSFSGARPPYGVIGDETIMSELAAPIATGGNKQSLVGFHRTVTWPAVLTGVENLAPTVANLAASNLTQTTADLSFDADPGGLPTTLLVEYTANVDGAGDPIWSGASSVTPTASPVLASATITQPLTGLTAAATYYWRVTASNTVDTTTSDEASFTTLAVVTGAPIPVASSATSIGETGATLVGSVNPQNLSSTYYFQYGTSSTLASSTSTTPATLSSVDAAAHTVSAVVTGLSSSTTYYFRVHAYNAAQPEAAGGVDSSIVSFATTAPVAGSPIPTPGTPSTDRATILVVPGTVDPNGASTTWKAQASSDNFSTVAAETSAATLSSSVAGNEQSVSGSITGLTPGTAYKTRISATNSSGTVNTAASSSISTEPLPTVALQGTPVDQLTSTTARLKISVGHPGITPDITGSYEYGTTTSYGTSIAIDLAHTFSNPIVTDSGTITGLSPSTTYHWRSTVGRDDADNTAIHLADQTFTTSAAPSVPSITTPTAYGPASAISPGATVTTPAYRIQVKADGSLQRSDTLATVTASGTQYTSGVLVVESDTAGTLRQPVSGALDNLRVHTGKLILRELLLADNIGRMEVTSAAADYAIEFQGCAGVYSHFRAVDIQAGDGIRITKSPSGRFPGQAALTPTWTAVDISTPTAPVLTAGTTVLGAPVGLRLDNFTAHFNAANTTGTSLVIDAGLNVVIGGFDPGVSCTPSNLPQHAVRIDAALRSGGVKTDIQDVYLASARDATATITTSASGKYSVRVGTCKRSGVWAAQHPNTAGSRPDRPLWFELSNTTQPGSETSGNTTNAGVLAEHFVNRDWFAVNTVNATFRDGATKAQAYEIRSEVFDPAASLTLWTPADIADNWPNGARRFITTNSLKRGLGARPTNPATLPATTPYSNKAVIDSTWTHMGGVSGDGVTEIKDVVFDPDQMVDGTNPTTPFGPAPRFATTIKKGAQVTVASSTVVNTLTPTTVPITGDISKYVAAKTTAITGASSASPIVITANAHGYKAPTGTDPKQTVTISGVSGNTAANGTWIITVINNNTFSLDGSTFNFAYAGGGSVTSRKDAWGLYTNYVDANLGANGVEAGTGYRRQLSFTGISGSSFSGVLLVPGPTSTPGLQIPPFDVLKITAGVAESFYPHGLPTGESVQFTGITGLSGAYTVTRIDTFTFSINGQGAFSWTPSAGTVGTCTPQTLHAYGLAGAETSITLPAGTTIDDGQNENYGQPVNNCFVNLSGHIRLIRCTINDATLSAMAATDIIELVDCDGSVTGFPGKYDYDNAGNLGVAGKYDRANQHYPRRMLTSNNVVSSQEALWFMTRYVNSGAHGDVLPGKYAAGSRTDESWIDQGSPVGTNNDNSSNVRAGITTTLPGFGTSFPKILHGAHGDISQWYDRRNPRFSRTLLATQAHASIFTRLGTNWEQHLAAVLTKDTATGSYKVTTNEDHGFDTGDTCLIKSGGPLLGLEFVVDDLGDKRNFILRGATYPPSGAQTTADLVKSIHVVVPGFLRSVIATPKYVDTSDFTRSTPVGSKGNTSISLTTSFNNAPALMIVGELDYHLTMYDSIVDNGGAFNLSDPLLHTELVDLGTPNRNAFSTYAGSSIPGATATPHYVAS